MIKLGFKRLYSDTGVYINLNGKDKIVVILYVDDIIFARSNKTQVIKSKKGFMEMWECRDLGVLKEYLGMNISKDKKGITIDQIKYATKVVERFGQQNCKPTRTPLPAGYKPMANMAKATSKEVTFYQKIIGSLLYLTLGTRPDITESVIKMSQFMVNPSKEHLQKAMYIVKYVASTLNCKIPYTKNEGLIAYADADWASDTVGRKAVSGNLIMLAGAPILWSSRKQKTTALSSTESEYMSASDCCKQILWVEHLYEELGFNIKSIILCVDNQGAIFSASNPVVHNRMKHIDIRYHFIRDCIEKEQVILKYIDTNEQLADILTKSLTFDKFREMRSKIGLVIS